MSAGRDKQQPEPALKQPLPKLSSNYNGNRFFEAKMEAYMKFAKIMLVLQHGNRYDRNRLTDRFIERFGTSCYVCTDTPKRLNEFYLELQVWGVRKSFREFCRDELRRVCEIGTNLVIVNLEYLKDDDILYFTTLSEDARYILVLFPPVPPKRIPYRESSCKCDAPLNTAKVYHEYFGWYLNEMDSLALREEALMYITDCWIRTTDFANTFKKYFCLNELSSHFQMESASGKRNLAYCVAKTCSRRTAEASAYLVETGAGRIYGTVSTLRVVGFVVSPRVVAAIVRLNRRQRELWEMDDLNLSLLKKRHCRYLRSRGDSEEPGDTPLTSCSSKCKSTVRILSGLLGRVSVLSQNERGRDANFLLGVSESAVLYNVRYDVVEAMWKADGEAIDTDHGYTDIGKALAKGYGKYWMIVMKKALAVEAVFTSLCSTNASITQNSEEL